MSITKAEHIHGIYIDGCINCGGPIEDIRLLSGLPCIKCLPKPPEKPDLKVIYNMLRKGGTLKKGFIDLYNLNKWSNDFKKVFTKAVGNRPWRAQITWARRVLKGESFSIIAPTGIGKTVFGILTSIYLTKVRGRRSKYRAYLILPTTPLVKQVYEKTVTYLKRLGYEVDDVICYHSDLTRKERDEVKSKIQRDEFRILITTNQFLSTRYELLKGKKFKFIFVDDVDAVLRSSKNIVRLIHLLGFRDDGAIDKTIELLYKYYRVRGGEDDEKIEIWNKINKYIRYIKSGPGRKGVLVISSATGRPKGIRVKLFKLILNFDIGLRSETLRNIYDVYSISSSEEENLDKLVYLVRRLGPGGLIYVPVDRGVEYAENIKKFMIENGIKADTLISGRLSALEKFLNGEIDVLIGVAIYYGVMVRGLDYPDKIKYAIFLGSPRFKFGARFTDPNLIQIAKTLNILKDIQREEVDKIEYWLRLSNRIIRGGSQYQILRINEVLRGERKPESRTEEKILDALEYIRNVFKDKMVLEKIKKHPDVVVEEIDGELYLLIPDVYTYIQASGRTSRLYAGGITKGLSIILETNEKLLKILMRRMEWIFEEVKWNKLDDINLDKIIHEINEDRKKVLMIRMGELKTEFRDPIKPVFIVVESPNKARTIARFFGKPSIRRRDGLMVYEVTTGDLLIQISASGGHIYDIVENVEKLSEKGVIDKAYADKNFYGVYIENDEDFIPIYGSVKRCEDGHQFITPEYIDGKTVCPKCRKTILNDKKVIVNFLREVATEVDTLLVGTDPDTEGEKIGWDIAVLLKPYTSEVKRIEFHEVTRKALLKSINNPRNFSEKMVEAQIVRRIEDRWIGFELTQRIYSELRYELHKTMVGKGKRRRISWDAFIRGGWSAGRVQSPVLKWIVDRGEEVARNKVKGIIIDLDSLGITIRKPLKETPNIDDGITVRISYSDIYSEEVKPPPPYTTDTMIADANKIYRMSAYDVMKTAQELFEAGLITYHRTDSTHISDEGKMVAKTYLKLKYGGEGENVFWGRGWGGEGAHEGIRPTKPIDVEMLREMIIQGDLTPPFRFEKRHYQLYRMIFNRFILSQVKPAIIKRVKYRVIWGDEVLHEGILNIDIDNEILRIFYQIYYQFKDIEPKDREIYIPRDKVRIDTIYLVSAFTQGDIIRLMRERQIGRPSTYSKIISTLLERKYVREVKNLLLPTLKGKILDSFLRTHYGIFVSEDRTRLIEKYMEEIERGVRDYRDVLKELYQEINSLKLMEEAINHPKISGDTGFAHLPL
ncbi:MAG TPA: reverse gyrase [Thermoprotei archaeon]|nr:reverse gyrase [Thermoprotei archaeon]